MHEWQRPDVHRDVRIAILLMGESLPIFVSLSLLIIIRYSDAIPRQQLGASQGDCLEDSLLWCLMSQQSYALCSFYVVCRC